MWTNLVFLSWMHSQTVVVDANHRKHSKQLPQRQSICLCADNSRLRSFSLLDWEQRFGMKCSSLPADVQYLKEMYQVQVPLFAQPLSVDWNSFSAWGWNWKKPPQELLYRHPVDKESSWEVGHSGPHSSLMLVRTLELEPSTWQGNSGQINKVLEGSHLLRLMVFFFLFLLKMHKVAFFGVLFNLKDLPAVPLSLHTPQNLLWQL